MCLVSSGKKALDRGLELTTECIVHVFLLRCVVPTRASASELPLLSVDESKKLSSDSSGRSTRPRRGRIEPLAMPNAVDEEARAKM